jgi:hypothetical protein
MSLSEVKFKTNTSGEYSNPFDPLKRPQYDWKRKKKLSTSHSKYTMDWLISNAKHFDSLNFLQRILIVLFWTKRNICHSFREIAEDCGLCDDHAAVLLMKMLESVGFLEIKNQSYKGKHCGRNWYKLTYKGQKLLRLILNKAFKGTPIPNELLPIEIKKKYPNWTKQETQKSKVSESSKNFFKDITKSSLRSDNKKDMLGQPGVCSSLSFERKGGFCREWLVWNPALFDSGALRIENLTKNYFKSKHKTQERFETPEYKRRKKLIQEYESFKKCTRRKLFESFGFIEQYDSMHIGIWRILEKEPIEKIDKALKLMQKKLHKGKFRMKSFVGFFTHLMKKAEHMGYNTYKAEVYKAAIEGKETPATERLLSGHDSSEFVALVKEIEAKTGEILPLKTLKWMLSKGNSQVWLKALQAVKFRRNLDEPRKPKTRTENVYELRKKKETVRTQEAMRDGSGKLLRDENGKPRWHFVEKTEETGFYEEVLVGTREVPIEDHGKAPKEKIKSWVALWVYAVKLGSVEAINEKFFQKREEELKPMPNLPGSGE